MPTVINKTPVDQFTLVHTAAGVLARRLDLSLLTTVAMGVVWDFLLEPELKAAHPEMFPFPSQDAPRHAVVDAFAPAVGWLMYDAFLKGIK